jgi:hypothetical protein
MAKTKRQTKKQKAAAKAKKRKNSIRGMIRQVVSKGAAPIAFWQQLSEKDYQVLNADGNYAALDYLGKLKVAANILTGSLTGRVAFSDQYNPSPGGQPRINPAGVINKWTGIGIAAKIYGKVGKAMKLPEQAMIDRVGSKLIFGGAVGGFFDPPGNPGGYVSTANVTPNVMVQNRSQTNRAFATAQRNRSFVPVDSFDYSTGSAFR